MSKDAKSLVWDYLVFIIFVIASTFVALYSKCFGPKVKTKADYVFAAGKVSMAAMMLSIARGTLGVRSFLGYPSELFYRGATMWETLYGMVLAYPIVCFIFVPVYFSLGITSVYQYLDLRFKSQFVKQLASGTYIVRALLNQGVTVFTPCVALNTVIGIPYWASISGISIVSIIFNILGGLKAAIWADVMQGVTMIVVSMAIMFQGCFEAGGPLKVIEVNREDGRLNFFNFSMDLTTRVTTTSAIIGQLFMSLSIFGCQQNFVQRYCSMRSQKEVTRTMMWNIPVITVLFSLSWLVGMVVYAVYSSCDPLSSGYIQKYDEILPFFVEDRFSYLPGILGLFMASLFNGALSLNVSNLNSLATVTFEDFVRPIPIFKDMKDSKQLWTIKFIGVVYGLVIMGISFGVGLLDGVIESSMLVTSATSGPLLGVFVMALLIPCANWKGASVGVISGHIVTLWIAIGGLTIEKPPASFLQVYTDGCSNTSFNDHILKPEHRYPSWTPTTTPSPFHIYNDTHTLLNTTRAAPSDPLTQLYSVTYMYYSLIGCFITILFGWTVSYFTGSESDRYDEELIHPIARKMAKIFPGKKRIYSQKVICEDDIPEKCEKTTKLDSVMQPSTSCTNPPGTKTGTLNPTFSDLSDESIDGIYRTKL
ncbi:sodium-coupled monocarboxylate transporter 1 [Diorhabda carinulata]|uniref:sodium-coupled monocarboxylate transporter 1 n=1 Tax=Diorhabda carinulata TaxID=1163345 RepID=UPI0025A18BAF|nr:sodium-coupled monocarboxylate transporter 1 [Diorhabda carinulata]XP_057651522.1 sodium-coupled monocarboxylate transporter 1 [Diorhabda carinulata]XP_057651523.1 sodium-coupled monocarboxylate transporter 1 [Diorhabda carinulata]XP_057651524.1 sodium-coupled monocarboxylate transporter 1 [Diorhabda carinulata]XP_057651525.1 sodium-coupled monocarboxylate transporter 1 [Diorhabda carinulata]XP_057651526.1 sodium-coupled monocarboxylate transporter 1 [Diorhabda carinulata]XP_057651527.1 so